MKQARLAAGWLKQKRLALTLVPALAVMAGAALLYAPHAFAQTVTSATWKNHTTLHASDGRDFVYAGQGTLPGDGQNTQYILYRSGPAGNCEADIFFSAGSNLSTATKGSLWDGAYCNGYSSERMGPVSITNKQPAATAKPASSYTLTAKWTDYNTLHASNGDDYTYAPNSNIQDDKASGSAAIFVGSKPVGGDSKCKSYIYFAQNDADTASEATLNNAAYCQGVKGSGFGSVKITNSRPAAPDAGGSTDGLDPCDASNNVLSWIVCPIIGLLNEGVIQMQNIIDHLMAINVGDVFDYSKAPGKNYYAAWNSFRLFGVVLVVIAGLVMVISQALGFEIFDAYTVKKVLPRLFVAAIGISLSWWLLKYLAQITNDLGLGIRGIIYYPFRDMGQAGLQNTGSYLITILFGSTALFALTIGGVLSLIATAGLAALVAFLVLIIRELVLIFLIVLAPLAIACYVLPNTERAYKLWWDSLFKGMLMFPIISGFIAIGRVFSVVASNTSSGAGSSINQVIALIAFFLPYFALPFTFRLAGGAIATIGGLANDRSRGAFDRLKKYRATQMAAGWERKKNENLFRGGTDSNFRGRINRGVASTINAPGALAASGNVLKPHRWGAAVRGDRSSRDMQEIERTMKENRAYQGWAHNDDLNRAASSTNNAGELRDYMVNNLGYERGSRDLEDTVANVEAVRRSMSPDAFQAMTTRQFLAGGTAVKSSDTPGAPKTAAGEVMAAIARASVNDDAMAGSLVANMRNDGMRAGRVDYAGAGFGTTMGQVNRLRKELRESGRISEESIQAASKVIHDDIYSSQGGYALINAGLKPDAVKEMAPTMLEHAELAMQSGNDRDLKLSLAAMKGVYENLQSSSPNKAKIVSDQVFGSRVLVRDLSPGMRQSIQRAGSDHDNDVLTYQQLLTAIGGDPEFREMHREWGNEAEYQMTGAAQQSGQEAAQQGGGPEGP